jgi:hypothetical protein
LRLRTRYGLALGAATALLVPAQPAMAVDAGIVGIHVTQGVQTTSGNSVPLVADRSTAIRVLVSNVEGDVSTVTGHAHVTVDGARVTPPAGTPSVFPLNPVADPSLNISNQALIFELLAPSGIAPRNDPFSSNDVDIQVDISAPNDTNPSNDSASVNNLRVVSKQSPQIRFRRVEYTPFSTTMPARTLADPTYIAPGSGDAYMTQALPVNQASPDLYVDLDDDQTLTESLPCPLISFSPCTQHPLLLDSPVNKTNPGPPEGDDRLHHNTMDRMVLAAGTAVQGESLILYEWFPAGSLRPGFVGLGAVGSGVSLGVDITARGQSTFAHEIGHNLGLVESTGHNAGDFLLNDVVGWDVGGRLVNNPFENQVTSRLKQTSFLDRWNPKNNGATSTAWITRINYEFTMNALPPAVSRLLGNKKDNEGPPRRERPRCVRHLPVIFGTVERYDPETLVARQIGPLKSFHSAWCNVLPIRPGGVNAGANRVRAAGAPGGLTAIVDIQTARRRRRLTLPVDARVEANTHDLDPPLEPTAAPFGLGPFTLQVPVAGQIRSIKILDDRGKTILSKRAPASPPKLSVTSPRRNSRIARRTTIRWSVKTPGPRSNLRYVVAYSPDHGGHWTPLGVDLTGRSLRFDPSKVTRSKAGKIRVIASDGVNSDAVTIAGLSVK